MKSKPPPASRAKHTCARCGRLYSVRDDEERLGWAADCCADCWDEVGQGPDHRA